MKSKQGYVVGALVVALALVLVTVATLDMGPQPVQAAVITPVSITQPAGERWASVQPWGVAVLASDTRSSCYETAGSTVADVQYLIGQGAVNTTTITLQYTNDQVTFVDGGTVVSARAADGSGMVQLATFGRYSCFYTDLANTNDVTVTVNAVFR